MKSKTTQARGSNTLDPFVRLPKWAQRRITEIEERVKRAEATIPWTKPGMEWFTLFWPGPEPKARAPQKLFTCGDGGTHCVCTLGPEDYVFVGRGKKPNATSMHQVRRGKERGRMTPEQINSLLAKPATKSCTWTEDADGNWTSREAGI